MQACQTELETILSTKEVLEKRTLKDDEDKKRVQEELEQIKKDYDSSKKKFDILNGDKEKFSQEKAHLKILIREKEKKNNELLKEEKKQDKIRELVT